MDGFEIQVGFTLLRTTILSHTILFPRVQLVRSGLTTQAEAERKLWHVSLTMLLPSAQPVTGPAITLIKQRPNEHELGVAID